ncbi:MAG TPA: hypothetical protein VHN79_07795, partial [Lacunisphaera sp.]|nr:hypothetical protein [Lacunisphaera sp.]
AACGAILFKLLLALPRHTAFLFVLSGGMFIAGSMGMEMLGAHYARIHQGHGTWSYTICYTIEEVLEMTGVALFIRTALRHAIETQPVPPPTAEAAAVSLPI